MLFFTHGSSAYRWHCGKTGNIFSRSFSRSPGRGAAGFQQLANRAWLSYLSLANREILTEFKEWESEFCIIFLLLASWILHQWGSRLNYLSLLLKILAFLHHEAYSQSLHVRNSPLIGEDEVSLEIWFVYFIVCNSFFIYFDRSAAVSWLHRRHPRLAKNTHAKKIQKTLLYLTLYDWMNIQ